jgi:hypothetical protein
MKNKHKNKHLNKTIENDSSHPMWFEGMDPKTETEFDEILNGVGLKRTTPIQRVVFDTNDDISMGQIVADIEKAQSLKSSYRFTLTPLVKPNYVAIKSMEDFSDGPKMSLAVAVGPYDQTFNEFLPFSGIFVLNGMIIVANDTEDDTAQMMIKLCHQIWVKDAYKPFLKEVA